MLSYPERKTEDLKAFMTGFDINNIACIIFVCNVLKM